MFHILCSSKMGAMARKDGHYWPAKLAGEIGRRKLEGPKNDSNRHCLRLICLLTKHVIGQRKSSKLRRFLPFAIVGAQNIA